MTYRPVSNAELQADLAAVPTSAASQPATSLPPPVRIQRQADSAPEGVASPRLVSFAGIPVFVDRPRGFTQLGADDNGVPWERTYQVDYGHIPGTLGGDGEALDVFLGPDQQAPLAWWAEQVHDGGERDEFKVLLGFADEAAARACFVAHIPERLLAGMTSAPIEHIRALVGVSPWTALAIAGRRSKRVALLGSSNQPRHPAVALSTSEPSSVGPALTVQRYLDRVVDGGLGAAPSALRGTLSAVMGAIEGATSYAQVEQRLVDLAGSEELHALDFETLVQGACLLGLGAGAWATGEEASS